MKYWTIGFKERRKKDVYPVYEGNNGRYYLGGSPKICFPLIANTRKQAEEYLKNVRTREENAKDGREWVKRGTFLIKRCVIEIV